MRLTSTAQQAIHAVLCVAGNDGDAPVRIDEIAAVLDCPRNYLSKTLHILAHSGVLRSTRGPRGGFRLGDAPERLTLARVVAPFEPAVARRCLIGRATCGDAHPCAAHHRWTKVATTVDDFFTNTTIASLLRDHPPATDESRESVRSVRHSNPRPPHGSVQP